MQYIKKYNHSFPEKVKVFQDMKTKLFEKNKIKGNNDKYSLQI